MAFTMIHENYNVSNLDTSIAFYREALGLHEVRRKNAADGSFTIVYMADATETFELELTCCAIIRRNMILANASFIWLSARMTLKPHTQNTARWAASALKTKRWAFTSSKIPTDTGWKLCRRDNFLSRLVRLFDYQCSNYYEHSLFCILFYSIFLS